MGSLYKYRQNIVQESYERGGSGWTELPWMGGMVFPLGEVGGCLWSGDLFTDIDARTTIEVFGKAFWSDPDEYVRAPRFRLWDVDNAIQLVTFQAPGYLNGRQFYINGLRPSAWPTGKTRLAWQGQNLSLNSYEVAAVYYLSADLVRQ